jgi:predicted O-methyltransferase YrrM
MNLIETIRQLAGPQRQSTFAQVAQAAIAINAKTYVETGCYRGINFDGQSTLILALLALETGGHLTAIDISADSIMRAAKLIAGYESRVSLVLADSLLGLQDIAWPIDVLYLDSYDHDPRDPEPCQQHQLAEAQITIPKMAERSIILLDDCNLDTGGKSKLSDPFIRESGFTQVAKEYQNVYHRGCGGLI